MSPSLVDVSSQFHQDFTEIPVIDLAGVFDVDNNISSKRKREVAKEIRDACLNVGFFYIKNHTVPPSLVDDAFQAGKEFFDLPTETKRSIDVSNSTAFRGYNGILSENVNPANRGDLHEGFNMGPGDGESETTLETSSMTAENQWPNERDVPRFKERVMPYYEVVVNLGKTLFRLFALALELDEDYFEDKITQAAAILRLLHYPPQSGVVDERVMGIGAHSDYECFTILRQDDVPALQVLNSKKEWIDAPPMKDTFVVNIGDQFARWTNDIFKSTIHRAINRSNTRRYSSPLFFGTNYNLLITPIPTCGPPKYEPVLAGEYVRSKLEAGYAAGLERERKGEK